MNRQIKFRAIATQDYETNTDGIQKDDWVYGYYYFCKRRMSGIIVTELSAESGGVGSGLVQVEIEVDNKIVGQFTGLKDKNGKEIYEGDIVLIPDDYTEPITDDGRGPTESCNHFAEVMFGNGEFVFIITDSANGLRKGTYTWNQICEETGIDDLEIIGNIHENPELLK